MRAAVVFALVTAAAVGSLATAHVGLPPAPHDLWSSWSLSPPLLISLAFACFVYARGYRRSRQAASGTVPTLKRRQAACFAAGIAGLFLALVSPLDALGSSLLSAHMTQHLLLLVVVPPLLVLSAPGYATIWSLPPAARRGLAVRWNRSTAHRAAHAAWNALVTPIGALLVYTGLLWLWHAPGLYQAALAHDLVHVLEHASFLAAAYLFWTVLFAPLGRHRVTGGTGAALLFGASLQGSALGALMAFSPTAWYGSYAVTTSAWGLTPLQDQQLAGVLMWMPLGTIYVLLACVLLFRWLRAGERAAVSVPPPVSPRRPPARVGAESGLVSFSTVVAILGLALLVMVVVYVFARAGTGGITVASQQVVEGGNAANGPDLLRQYGCVTCHRVAGVREADGAVGPPLSRVADRAVIAGQLANTPANLIRWIRFPQEIAPGTAMPDLRVSESHARDIAAYLYSLE